MINLINITCTKHAYTVWLNGKIFLTQPICYSHKIPATITPQAYWYLHVLHVLDQHGLLSKYQNLNTPNKGS